MKRTVLAFKIGGFSLINAQLGAALNRQLPECEFQWLDVVDDICRKNPTAYAAATAEALLRYGGKMWEWKLPPSAFIPRTNVFIRFFQKWIKQNVTNANAFTFQTQSLFNAASEAVPHFVYTDHSYLANLRYPEPKPLFPSSELWLETERQIYRHAKINFVSSEFAARSLREDYQIPLKQVSCVHSGMNLDFPPALPERGDDQRILFVGVQWERKGGPELVEAFLKIAEEFPAAELHLVGGDFPATHSRIKVHGRISRDEVPAHLRSADIFCLPSRLDPSAGALAEAAAYGLPVIGTRVGGNAERVIDGETGFLVDSRRPDQMAGALRKLLVDPALRRRMGEAGRKLVAENFTWDAVAMKIATQIRASLNPS